MRNAAVAVALVALGLAACDGTEQVGGDAAPVGVGASTAAPAGSASGSAGPTGTPASATPAESSAASIGDRPYGIVTAVDPGRSTVTVNVVDWFGGDAARRACAEDGKAASGAWCVQYYYRDVNPMLRTLPVADRAAIAVLEPGDTGPATKQADLAAVRAGLDLVRVYRLRLAAGTVTGMDPVYVP